MISFVPGCHWMAVAPRCGSGMAILWQVCIWLGRGSDGGNEKEDCYLTLSPYLTIVYSCPSVSLIGDILLYISYIVVMLHFQLFLAILTSIFCNSSDFLSIYIISLYWYRCSNFNIHFMIFPATNRSFRIRSKSCLLCIDVVISVLSLCLCHNIGIYRQHMDHFDIHNNFIHHI